ncbi:MAG: hypothetical protein JNK02_15415 [Planctomycetes bacterium]|nr:hypothetical protein [Planctomycetota bacterium]
MRAFLGLLPPPQVAQRVVAAARAALGAGLGRVYPAADLHLTLVFLGAIEPARAAALAAGLGGAFTDARPVRLRLGG